MRGVFPDHHGRLDNDRIALRASHGALVEVDAPIDDQQGIRTVDGIAWVTKRNDQTRIEVKKRKKEEKKGICHKKKQFTTIKGENP
jgi:hypothetical protein